MKKSILLTFALCLSIFAFTQQYGWVDISSNMPAQGGFNDIHVIGNEIWISGGNDEVFYSADGGETFAIQSLPPQSGNYGITSSVFMKNNMEGYVVTFSGEINKTIDGGTTWTTLHEPGGGLNSVHFPPNSDTGYACGINGTVWSFNDTSITDISPSDNASNLQSIYFPVDNNDGKVCGETTVVRRINDTWSNLQIYDNNFFYNSIFFINDVTGWAVGTNGKIIRTVDGTFWNGKTSNTNTTLNGVFFINSLKGWTVGSEVLLHTVDGGETWMQELASQTVGKELVAVYFASANSGYIVGNGILFKYTEVTGLEDIEQPDAFNIYPNPAKDKLKIQSLELCPSADGLKVWDATIEIYDLNGKKLLEEQFHNGINNVEIDVSSLKSGVYFCVLSVNENRFTRKMNLIK